MDDNTRYIPSRLMRDLMADYRSRLDCEHTNVIPGHVGDDCLLIECSDADDYVDERIHQCDLMGYDPLAELGYWKRWEG